MWKNNHRRSVSSATIWGVSLLSFGGLIFWYLGWLPVSFQGPETGKLDNDSAEVESAEFGMGDDSESLFPNFDTGPGQLDLVGADASGLSSQTEPPVEEEITAPPARIQPGPSNSVTSKSKPAESPSSAATAQPAVIEVPFDKRAAESAADHKEVIVQTGGELSADDPLPAEVETKLQEIDGLLKNDQLLTAHRELSTLYWVKPQWRHYFQDRINQTAKSIYSSPQPHYMKAYEVQPGDRLSSIAEGYHVPWEYLVRLNGIDPRKIRPGQKLKVIKGPFSARIDLSNFELTIHAHGYFVSRYKIGIGKDETTPIGKFKVMTKIVNPTYYGPGGNVIDGDDPINPLGERWIDIGDSYGIHGTIDPESIGRAQSRGCIRMFNSDAEEVYDLLGVNSEVVISR